MPAVNAALARLQRQYRSAAKIGRRLLVSSSDHEQTVVYVAGQQRSGTNMLMNVLDRHWQTDVYHETDARAFQSYQMRDLETIRGLVNRSSASLVVFKALCELQRLRDLLDAFPKARALWLVRHYSDVSSSMARQFSSTAEVLKRMRADPKEGGWRGERMTPSVRSLLDDCIGDDVTELSAAAFQWYMRNQLYFDQELNNDPRVHIILYEDLVTRRDAAFASALAFLRVDLKPSMIGDVFAGSVGRACKPLIDPRIEALCHQLYES